MIFTGHPLCTMHYSDHFVFYQCNFPPNTSLFPKQTIGGPELTRDYPRRCSNKETGELLLPKDSNSYPGTIVCGIKHAPLISVGLETDSMTLDRVI